MKEAKKAMSNSPLVCFTKISPNRTSPRTSKIDTISIHCMAGQLSVESCGNSFASTSRNASSNYGVGPDGRIGMYVEEKDRSWCTSSKSNDMRAITIEVASDSKPPYAVTDAAFNGLINLLVDICRRNGISSLKWQGNKNLIGQVDKQNMTVHRWFAPKACPGDYLYNKHAEIAALVNAKLNSGSPVTVATPTPVPARPQPIQSQPVDISVEITASSLNVRTGPDTTNAHLRTLPKGTVKKVVAKSNGWGKLANDEGWISLDSKFVKEVNPHSISPVKPAVKFEKGHEYVLQDEMSVRTGPGTNFPRKTWYQLDVQDKNFDLDKDGALDKGTKIVCLESKNVGDEVWIRCKSGWVAGYHNKTVYAK